MRFGFQTTIIEWRGPAPFFFAPIPDQHVAAIADAAKSVTYGWGMIPVDATIMGVDFVTSLYPKDGGYLLPIKDAVRKKCGVTVGDLVDIELTIRPRNR